jgi:hypothetical protein
MKRRVLEALFGMAVIVGGAIVGTHMLAKGTLMLTKALAAPEPAGHHCTLCGCCDDLGCRRKAPEAEQAR